MGHDPSYTRSALRLAKAMEQDNLLNTVKRHGHGGCAAGAGDAMTSPPQKQGTSYMNPASSTCRT